MTKKTWAGIAMIFMMVLVAAFMFVAATTPHNVRSGVITDKWADGGEYVFEIDNSHVRAVDGFTYHNIEVGWTYHWMEPTIWAELIMPVGMMAMVITVCLIAIVAGDD